MNKINKENNIKGIKVGVILGVNLTGKQVTLSGMVLMVVSRANPFKVIKIMKRRYLKVKSQLKAGFYLLASLPAVRQGHDPDLHRDFVALLLNLQAKPFLITI